MENASKALIIAGSILVSIVIITLGVMIVNNVRGTIEQGINMSDSEIMAYNSKFEAYAGPSKTGTQVKSLLTAIRNHNNTQTDDTRKIVVIGDGANNGNKANVKTQIDENVWKAGMNDGVSTALSNVRAGYTYEVTFGYDQKSGLIISVALDRLKN